MSQYLICYVDQRMHFISQNSFTLMWKLFLNDEIHTNKNYLQQLPFKFRNAVYDINKFESDMFTSVFQINIFNLLGHFYT